jgi:hypothetical protein
LIYNANRVGLKTAPCGTPTSMLTVSLPTWARVPYSMAWIVWTREVGMPLFSSLTIRLRLGTLSKAFFKSTKTTKVLTLFLFLVLAIRYACSMSLACYMISVKSTRLSSQDLPGTKPRWLVWRSFFSSIWFLIFWRMQSSNSFEIAGVTAIVLT